MFHDRHARAVFEYFARRTRDPESAADLTAETFAAAIVARRRFRPGPVPASAPRSGTHLADLQYARHALAPVVADGAHEDVLARFELDRRGG